ncbi:helix-turn-helix transcriptional regulator [Rubellimicrobium aerolatum]|uniref:Helix-turn-helix transcriptional regulator n=1 Tax=Rubellimicrobium aerolatum TaxID=490979 RepID=A0ABW0SBH2_9RHOB|nr:prophage regulatory protein [Rubellimicrobium aerolatum]
MTNTLYLSDKQAAERYGVAREAIWRWKRDGDFPKAVKLSRGMTRWQVPDLGEWERSREMHFAIMLPVGSGNLFGRMT